MRPLRRALLAACAVFFVGLSSSGIAQFGPPCCTTPPIVAELSARPVGETQEQLLAWLSRRSISRNRSEIDLEVTALEGACETGCPPFFRISLDHLRRIQAGEDSETDFPSCCGSENNTSSARPAAARPAAKAPAPPALAATPAAPAADPAGPRFRSLVIRQLLSWTREPDEVPGWLGPHLERLPVDRLTHLQEALAGWCTPDRRCPAAMVIGRLTVERYIAARAHAEDVAQAERARAEEAELRKWDWLATILSGVIGGMTALLGALIALLVGQRHARRQTEAFEGTLRQLNKTLSALEDPRRGQNDALGRRARFGSKRLKPYRSVLSS